MKIFSLLLVAVVIVPTVLIFSGCRRPESIYYHPVQICAPVNPRLYNIGYDFFTGLIEIIYDAPLFNNRVISYESFTFRIGQYEFTQQSRIFNLRELDIPAGTYEFSKRINAREGQFDHCEERDKFVRFLSSEFSEPFIIEISDMPPITNVRIETVAFTFYDFSWTEQRLKWDTIDSIHAIYHVRTDILRDGFPTMVEGYPVSFRLLNLTTQFEPLPEGDFVFDLIRSQRGGSIQPFFGEELTFEFGDGIGIIPSGYKFESGFQFIRSSFAPQFTIRITSGNAELV